MTLIRRHYFCFLSIFLGLIFISACEQRNIRPTKSTSTDVVVINIDLTQKKTPLASAPALEVVPVVVAPVVVAIVLPAVIPIPIAVAIKPELAPTVQSAAKQLQQPTQTASTSGLEVWPTSQQKDHPDPAQVITPIRAIEWDAAHLASINVNPTKRIALAMPLHGKLGKVGQAVVDGFMAARFEAQNNLQLIPYIKVYDTSKLSSLDALYLEASADQIEMIIGPLDKNRVIELSQKDALPIPTLALNYIPLDTTKNATTNLVQFGLAIEDEAAQLAARSLAEGHQRIIILHQDQPWAIRAAQHFTATWIELGGQVADQASFSGAGDHSKAITEAFLITQSNERAGVLKTHLSGSGNTLKFEPRRRQDVDAIVLFSLPTDGRQIIPTLAFHYAGKLPVYASHHIYQGPTDTSRDQDLENVIFTDLPWLIGPPAMQQKISQTWLDKERYTRLFAVGVDAYHLFPQLEQLHSNSSKRLNGVTGVLRMNSQSRIVTQSAWGKFKSGKVVEDPTL